MFPVIGFSGCHGGKKGLVKKELPKKAFAIYLLPAITGSDCEGLEKKGNQRYLIAKTGLLQTWKRHSRDR
jgi:hypothetical protein